MNWAATVGVPTTTIVTYKLWMSPSACADDVCVVVTADRTESEACVSAMPASRSGVEEVRELPRRVRLGRDGHAVHEVLEIRQAAHGRQQVIPGHQERGGGR